MDGPGVTSPARSVLRFIYSKGGCHDGRFGSGMGRTRLCIICISKHPLVSASSVVILECIVFGLAHDLGQQSCVESVCILP